MLRLVYQFAFNAVHSCRDRSSITDEEIATKFMQIGSRYKNIVLVEYLKRIDCGGYLQEKQGEMALPLVNGGTMDEKTRTEIEAAAFRGLIEHLQRRTDVQNIDLMNLAGFCRNCLSKWYMGAAKERGIDLSYEEAREAIYGMPYEKWKNQYQKETTAEQLQIFEETKPLHAFVSGHRRS